MPYGKKKFLSYVPSLDLGRNTKGSSVCLIRTKFDVKKESPGETFYMNRQIHAHTETIIIHPLTIAGILCHYNH